MVMLVVKRGDEDLFIYETNANESSGPVISDITAIYNRRLKVYRICSEMEELCEHGTMLPPEMMGLTDEQIEELKLVDVWATKCIPSGGFVFNKDPLGRRNGQQPQENARNVLKNAMTDAKELINKKLVLAHKPLTLKIIEEALNLLRDAVTIVYPMQLPPHDTIRMEFMNTEDLSGMQASREAIEPSEAQLWFAGRQVLPLLKLHDFIGAKDNTKVIVKLNSYGEGPPGREPVFTEDVRRRMMTDAYRQEEELKLCVGFAGWKIDLKGCDKISTSSVCTVTEPLSEDDVYKSREHEPIFKSVYEGDASNKKNEKLQSPRFVKNKLNLGIKSTEMLQSPRPFKETDSTASDTSSTSSVVTVIEAITKGNVYEKQEKYNSMGEWNDMDTDLIAGDKDRANSIDTVNESDRKDVVCETRECKPQLEGEETTSGCSDMPIDIASFIESMLESECNATGFKGEKFMDKLKELRSYLEADIMACDAKWTLFVAAAYSYRYRELLKPFPPRYIHATSHKPMIYPVNLVIIKTPTLKVILQDICEVNYEYLNAAVIDLLHYVLVVQIDLMLHTLTQANIESLIGTLHQGCKVPRPSHAFEIYNAMLGDQPEKSVRKFGSPMWAFYANELGNFYSIFTQGATQEPLLLYTNLENCLKKSPTNAGWGGSDCGSMISCVAVCEFDNIKEFVTWSKDGSVLKVAKNDLVRPRYLLYYGYRLTEHDVLVDIRPRPPTTCLKQHRNRVSAAVYIVVIAATIFCTPIGQYCMAALTRTANYVVNWKW